MDGRWCERYTGAAQLIALSNKQLFAKLTDPWLDRYAPRITTNGAAFHLLAPRLAGILAEVVSRFAGHWQVRNRRTTSKPSTGAAWR